jgi:5-formyltetrahydrofolate cyclo-ligase
MHHFVSDKEKVRHQVRCLKETVSAEEMRRQSEAVFRRVERTEQFRQASVILAYWSMPDEVQTHEWMKKHGTEKTFVLPVIDGEQLRLKRFAGEQDLLKHAVLDLYEPRGEDFKNIRQIQLAVVPGIAFDRNRRRMGRGKGYYDRLLPQLDAYKIGVGFDFQLFEEIPCDEHDVLMDEVIAGV